MRSLSQGLSSNTRQQQIGTHQTWLQSDRVSLAQSHSLIRGVFPILAELRDQAPATRRVAQDETSGTFL